MKRMKKVLCLLLALVMTLGAGFAVNSTEAKAADNKLKAPKNIRCGVGGSNYRSVEIPISAKKGDVKNVKAYLGKKKSSNLVVKKAYVYRSESQQSYAILRLYAKKAGKYTVKYDVYAEGKKKGKTRQFKVNADGYGDVLSSVTIDKKNVTKYVANYHPDSYYTSKDKIKIKFKAAPGCTIKKIEMSYYDKNGKWVTKKVKNGKTVKLGQYAYSYSYKSDESSTSKYSSSQKSMWAETRFTITYVDKYDQYNTKAKQTTNYYVYKNAKKWYKEK